MPFRLFTITLCLLFSTISTASIVDLETLIKEQNYPSAIKLGETLRIQEPKSPSILFYTALAYQNNEQPELAKSLYLAAIEADDSLPEVYNNLAMIYVDEKNYTKAADTLTLAINSQKNIATAYANLSQIYQHLASQAYQQVLDESEIDTLPNTQITPLLISSMAQQAIVQAPAVVEQVVVPKKIRKKASRNKAIAANLSSQKKRSKPSKISAKQTVFNWAKAWENKDVKNYINSYTKDYTPKRSTRTQWISHRTERLSRNGEIKIKVSNFDIRYSTQKVYITFDQEYLSDTYNDKVRKRLVLVLANEKWLISSEATLLVY